MLVRGVVCSLQGRIWKNLWFLLTLFHMIWCNWTCQPCDDACGKIFQNWVINRNRFNKAVKPDWQKEFVWPFKQEAALEERTAAKPWLSKAEEHSIWIWCSWGWAPDWGLQTIECGNNHTWPHHLRTSHSQNIQHNTTRPLLGHHEHIPSSSLESRRTCKKRLSRCL